MKIDPAIKRRFVHDLLKWNRVNNTRQMPWKGEKDPYKIWLSEVILQQTRVEQGIGYYTKFIRLFPSIHHLAKAPDSRVYKLWEGLGYYSRCKNLLETARLISQKKAGKFPGTYREILQLKGVGPYTAAAIASFAYNLPHAVVDGNVFRVLARVFGINKPIDSSAGKKYFSALAHQLLHTKHPGVYNQAIMDFGAVVCKPAGPQCNACIFQKYCKAFTGKRTNRLPVKEKRLKIKNRWFYYLVITDGNKTLIRQRTGNDIWKHLYEFVLIETDKKTNAASVLKKAEREGVLIKGRYALESISPVSRQVLSHQKIEGRFLKLKVSKNPDLPGAIAVSAHGLRRFAFPRFIISYMQKSDR